MKNENAKLKSRENLGINKKLEQRLIVLEDISNRFVQERNSNNNRRDRSESQEKHFKRRRKYQNNENDY